MKNYIRTNEIQVKYCTEVTCSTSTNKKNKNM